MQTKERKKPVRTMALTDGEKYRFWEWLKTNYQEYSSKQMSHSSVLEWANKDLGFEISEATLASAIINGIIPAWGRSKQVSESLSMKEKLILLEQRVDMLERGIICLCEKLGEDASEFLTNAPAPPRPHLSAPSNTTSNTTSNTNGTNKAKSPT